MKRLSGWDALLLNSETPNVHQHTLKVAVVDTSEFEGEPGFEVFCETLRSRMHLLEPLRYELVDIPLRLHRPMWRENTDIDFGYHVRRTRVAAPGGRRELDGLIGEIAGTPLDRTRPLWELYYAEGLADGRIAVIGKVHHALADGVASANLMARAMEWPDAGPGDSETGQVAHARPSTLELVGGAARDHVRKLGELPGVVRDSAQGIYRVRRGSRRRGDHPDLARQFNPPPTFLNHKLSPVRSFASATLSLAEAKETSRYLGVTLNDLVLATAAGGLRELLLTYDGHADEPLIASVPAATDVSRDRITGNALSTMLVSLPVHVDDPLEQVRLTGLAAGIAKENHELLGARTVGRWLEYVPPTAMRAVFGWTSRRRAPNQLFNVIVSNVPGPRHRGSIAGAVVSEIYSVGPLAAGSAMNVTVWSYVDQLNISVLTDGDTLADTHEATDAMVRAFGRIRDGYRVRTV
ncbi:WS/DGAT/MGAT family O-acyltransferase [Mycolicibacterium litorale]|uniref:Diacylglycerol O-acyltransferase n=1 Tax=Mycolicibacterium litorale TaxID=758802 RepID=A0AAD1IW60_9MYCO|nr:wax ester/triacylglycerol synthase family O-acyltransferase [Mycolicibacterium litorale]MCV7417674.1 wax ester/triacylglycerol synthase family O-acyltransferase [Mycolicibacterium litorale]TDY06938.1 diacylglycerol O-acyltransferase [Mycolicibacterium litorale]BBY18903.1 diacylglycerol O-acyltransferase [Mycolicibacterium litorale]